MENEREFEKEEQEVLSFIKNPAGVSTPDNSFSDLLKQKFLKKAGVINFSLGEIMKKSLKYAIIGVASVIVVVGGFFTYKALWPKPTDPLANLNLEALLQGAIQNNNLSRQGGTKALAAGLQATNEESTDMALGYGWYDNSLYIDFNYSHNVTTTESGPKADSCSTYTYYPGEKTVSETFSFWSEDRYESKTVVKTDSGDLIAYYQDSNGSYFVYFGGEYAINEVHNYDYPLLAPEPAIDTDVEETSESKSTEDADSNAENLNSSTEPQSDKPTTDDQSSFIDSYYGEDVKAVAYETINGQNYVIIEFKWDEFYCGSDSNAQTVYTRQWINEQTYEIYKEELYLDSVDASNRIVTTTYLQENQADVAWESVSDKFVNDYPSVPVHEYIYEYTSGIDETAVNEFLAANNFSVVVPNGYTTNGFYLSYEKEQENPDYCDRSLYPNTEIGNAMYTQSCELYADWYQPDYVPTVASGYYSQNADYSGTTMDIATYKNEVTEEQVIDSMGMVIISSDDGSESDNGFTKTGTKTITVDGTSVTANVYVSEQTYYESIAVATSSGEGEREEYSEQTITKTLKLVLIMFRYKNALHVISASNYEDETFNAETSVYPAFTSYSTLNATGKARIFELTTTDWSNAGAIEGSAPDEVSR